MAMQEELNNFKRNEVWSLVEKPKQNVIGTKWVFRNEQDEHGVVTRNKARLVVQDFTQVEGLDFGETFALVARLESNRILLAYTINHHFELYQMDVKSAFLNGPISELVYVEQPPGFEDPKHPYHVYKLHKALYRLKQAPRAWYECLRVVLAENGFEIRKADTTLFTKKLKNDLFVCQIYVDDIIFGSTNRIMTKRFEMSMMGELKFFLGLQYLKDVLKRFDMDNTKSIKTPMPINGHLDLDINGKEADVKIIMTRGSSSNVPEKRRKKRQDPVSTSVESDGDNSPPVQYPRRRIGKKKVDEVSPSRRRGKRTANRGRPSSGIRIEEPFSSLPPTRPACRPCDAQSPNHEAAIEAIRHFTKPVLTAAVGHETPRKAIDYLKNMARARTVRGRTPEQQLANNSDYRFYSQSSQVAKTAVNLFHQKNLDTLMTLEHNWSEELIGQFYASAYFEDSDDGSEEKPALSPETIRRLYVDDSSKVTLGTVKGLLPHFDLLLKMIKTTISPKSGDKSALTARHAALLWSMCTSASPFSVMKYIWNEIQVIVLDPSKGLAYAPFLHIMIPRVTGFYFGGECVHYPYHSQIPQAPKITGSKGRPVASSSQPPCASSPSLPVKKALSAIFGICKKNAVKIKSNERKINQILRESGHKIQP
uniref:Reverse transcriptase Ty1/copia-type domain-containing protein n=1 Tax=Oryza brachyantha TaxID=4533 RepID=J3N1K2_ORYBR